MFRATVSAAVYSDPWQACFDERRDALQAGSPRIAYYYAQPDTSTFRYRVFNMIEALEAAAPEASAAWFTAADQDRALAAVRDADVVVVCRALYTPHVAAFIELARGLGKTVLFDVDDLVFDTRYAHLVMETLDQTVDEAALQDWFGRVSRYGATLQLCEGAITTNAFLADRIREIHDGPIYVIPNFLNRTQLEISSRVLEAKRASGFARDDRIHIGYFSGTPTHNRDFAVVEPALLRLMRDDPRVTLRVVGFVPSHDRLHEYRKRIEVAPLAAFVNLQRLIGEVEINIVPLQDNTFTNCKSELKYFEAAIVGTITVASPVRSLKQAIRHGENGLLAHAQDWDSTLRVAIEVIERDSQMADTARADALDRYSPEAQASLIRSVLLRERAESEEHHTRLANASPSEQSG